MGPSTRPGAFRPIPPWARRFARGLFVFLLAGALPCDAAPEDAPSSPPELLVNGDMEGVDSDGRLIGWRVPPSLLEAGYAIGVESEAPYRGEHAARIDSRAVKSMGNSFGNLMQSVDATPYRGKRVRFRAAVSVAEGEADGRAQMWLRVDLESSGGAPRMGFFDNMDDRPIREKAWREYVIVGDVAADAKSIVVGVLTLGRCVVLVDDARLEIVPGDVAPTGGAGMQSSAQTQPFFTWWLALPLVALALFALGILGHGRLGMIGLRFTVIYWTLYALPTLVAGLVPFLGAWLSSAYEAGPVDAVVRWVAAAVLGIERPLVSAIANGSGDTTFSYVQALVGFVLALVFAAAWSLVDRRDADPARVKDILRSGLRWYLAMMMMGYGLAKLGTLMNQFPPPGLGRLADTYGSSSPMGLLWTFMGSSRAYTMIAGAMEVACALLLVWRRTALIGALASVGVMLNVMLLNFCYDVPVKLFSFHLVVAAACIALPDAGRLAHVFVGLGSGAAVSPAPRSRGKVATWVHRGLGAYVVVMLVALPVLGHVRRERAVAGILPALGEWKLRTLVVDGQPVTPATGEVEWLILARWPVEPVDGEPGWTTDYNATLVGGASSSGKATLRAGTLTLAGSATGASRLLSGDYAWSVDGGELRLDAPRSSAAGDANFVLEASRGGAAVRATFVPASREFLLTSRGFRWINEFPFNR